MAAIHRKVEEEAIGIVISRGSREEPVPAFQAYVWGSAPEVRAPLAKPKAA